MIFHSCCYSSLWGFPKLNALLWKSFEYPRAFHVPSLPWKTLGKLYKNLIEENFSQHPKNRSFPFTHNKDDFESTHQQPTDWRRKSEKCCVCGGNNTEFSIVSKQGRERCLGKDGKSRLLDWVWIYLSSEADRSCVHSRDLFGIMLLWKWDNSPSIVSKEQCCCSGDRKVEDFSHSISSRSASLGNKNKFRRR